MEMQWVELNKDTAAEVMEDVIQQMIYLTCVVYERPHCTGCLNKRFLKDVERKDAFLKAYAHLINVDFTKFASLLAKDVRAFTEEQLQQPCDDFNPEVLSLAHKGVAGTC